MEPITDRTRQATDADRAVEALADHETAIRAATLADVPAIRRLLTAHGNDGPITTVDIVGPYVRHLIAHAATRVSERAGEIVAFGAVADTGISHHLADLFVQPDLLGQGIGRPLLEAVFGDSWPRTTFASEDPRALPLYVRAGMSPLWPCLYLEGSPQWLPPSDSTMSVAPADPLALTDLERAWTGVDRRIDQTFWASQAEADGFAVLEAGQPVAFAYSRARQADATRIIDRLVVRPESDPIAPILAAIRHGARGGPVAACLLGPNPVLPILLEACFKLIDRDQFMTSDPTLIDPTRLLPNPGLL